MATERSMKYARYDITMYQGSAWSMTLYVKDNAGTAQDLTGYTAKMQIRNKPGGTLHDTLASPGSGISISGSAGLVGFDRTYLETLGYSFEKAVYDCFLTSGSGTRNMCIFGNVSVYQEITAP